MNSGIWQSLVRNLQRWQTYAALLCHSGTALSFPNENQEKLLQFLKNLLLFSLYGYSKEKCILPSCSRSGN